MFNILGEKVATLINEVQDPGKHKINFDAIDLSSGVYFYRITAGEYAETKKMILLR